MARVGVAQQEFKELVEGRRHVAEFHADRRAVHSGFFRRQVLFVGNRLFQRVFFLRRPLKDEIHRVIHEDKLHVVGMLQGVGNRLIFRRRFGQRQDDAQRRPTRRKGVGFPRERLQRYRQLAILQMLNHRLQIFTAFHVNDFRRAFAQAAHDMQRRRRRMMADRKQFQRFGDGAFDVVHHRSQQVAERLRVRRKTSGGIQKLLAQRRENIRKIFHTLTLFSALFTCIERGETCQTPSRCLTGLLNHSA